MKKLMIAALAMAAFGAANLEAQSANGQASVTIPTVLEIVSVGDLTIAGTAFDFSTTDTPTASGSVTVQTRANIVHAIEVTGADLTFNTIALPLEAENTAATFVALSGTAFRVAENLAQGNQSSTVNFQTTADVSVHEPGTYTGTVTYTVVTN